MTLYRNRRNKKLYTVVVAGFEPKTERPIVKPVPYKHDTELFPYLSEDERPEFDLRQFEEVGG